MKITSRNLLFFINVLLFFLMCPSTGGQEPECDDPPPTDAPAAPELTTYCADHPDFFCDSNSCFLSYCPFCPSL